MGRKATDRGRRQSRRSHCQHRSPKPAVRSRCSFWASEDAPIAIDRVPEDLAATPGMDGPARHRGLTRFQSAIAATTLVLCSSARKSGRCGAASRSSKLGAIKPLRNSGLAKSPAEQCGRAGPVPVRYPLSPDRTDSANAAELHGNSGEEQHSISDT